MSVPSGLRRPTNSPDWLTSICSPVQAAAGAATSYPPAIDGCVFSSLPAAKTTTTTTMVTAARAA